MKKFTTLSMNLWFVFVSVLATSHGAFAQLDSAYCVSDSTWNISTTTTTSTVLGYWSGVHGVLPDTSTFTSMAMIGQPYPFHTIDSVEGAYVIKAANNISYYHKKLILDTLSDLSIRLRLTVDDHAEVYINGVRLVGIYDTIESSNWHNPSFDVMIAEDGTVTNGYMGGEAYDSVTTVDMDSLFNIGSNDIIVVCRNMATATDKGGFSFRLDVKGTSGVVTVGEFVSKPGVHKSTVITPTNYSGHWSGVAGVLPHDSTFTIPAVQGQPYSFHSLDSVPDACVIKTGNMITYFRYEFDLTSNDSLNVRFRMNVDDAMEIYVNDHFIAREGTNSKLNWRGPNHDIKFSMSGAVSNGFMGGDAFDAYTSDTMSNIFVTGTNEIIVVVRNQKKSGDKGGFSIRMDIDSDGKSVIVKKKSAPASILPSDSNPLTADLYPNPTHGTVNILIDEDTNYDVYVYDMSGRVVKTMTDQYRHAEFDITEFAQGVYFVKVISGTRTYATKVMKQ